MKTYKMLVKETAYVSYYIKGTDATNAMENWAENGYQNETEKIEKTESDILECVEVTK